MISSALEAVSALLRQADAGLVVGLPGPSSVGLSLWPWRYAMVPTVAIPQPRPGLPIQPRDPIFDLQLLVLPRSPSSVADLAALDRTLALIAASPLLRTADGTILLRIGSGLAHAELAELFQAAAIPMSIGIEVVARMSPS